MPLMRSNQGMTASAISASARRLALLAMTALPLCLAGCKSVGLHTLRAGQDRGRGRKTGGVERDLDRLGAACRLGHEPCYPEAWRRRSWRP